jgi:hypothetical protein
MKILLKIAGMMSFSIAALALCVAAASPASAQEPAAPEAAPASTRAFDNLQEIVAREQREGQDARAGLAYREGERETLAALGFDPDDPVARAAFRAENKSSSGQIEGVVAGEYFLDGAWGIGGLAAERYAGSNDGTYRGIKAARLSNGDLVVVGEVTYPGGVKQLGITRRGPDGARIPWPNVNPEYAVFDDQYVVYPRNDATKPPIYAVHDVKVRNDRIYVLVTGHLTSPDTYAPNVVVFGADGSFQGWFFAYYTPESTVNDAVAMDIYNDKLVVLGRHSLSVTGGFWTAKWDIDAGGGLVNVTFGDFPAPGGNDRAEPVDIAFRRIGSFVVIGGNPGYYVLYSKKYNTDVASEDFDVCLLSATGANVPDESFAGGGVRCKAFDQAGSTLMDKAVALTTNGWGAIGEDAHEGVQVLASVARSIRDGIGMWELVDRADHPVFGTGAGGLGQGRILFGGCGGDGGEGCSDVIAFRASHTPTDLAISGSYLLVSGYRTTTLAGESSLLGKVHGHSGTVEQLTSFPDGFDGAGRFNSIVARDETHAVGIGEAVDPGVEAPGARAQIMTGLSSADTIFRDGFD